MSGRPDAPPHPSAPIGPDYLWDWRCNGKGCCCKGWRISLFEPDVTRLEHASRGTHLEARVLDAVRLKRQGPFARLILPSVNRQVDRIGEVGELARDAAGRCALLAEDLLCDLHRDLGEHALPNICQSFPVTVRASERGATTAWEFICPEVANALAVSDRPSRFVPPPPSFERALFAEPEPSPHAPRRVGRHRRIPLESARAFRLEAAHALAASGPRLLDALAVVHRTLADWESTGRPPDLAARLASDPPAGAALAFALGLRADTLLAEVPALLRTLAFARPFFEHHGIGPGPTVDTIRERLAAPSPRTLLGDIGRQLEALGGDATQRLANWLGTRYARHLAPRTSLEDDATHTSAMFGDALVFLGLMRRGDAPDAALAAAAVTLAEAWHRSTRRHGPAFSHALALRVQRLEPAAPSEHLRAVAAVISSRAAAPSLAGQWRRSLVSRIAALALERSIPVRDALPREAPRSLEGGQGATSAESAFSGAARDAEAFHASLAASRTRPAEDPLHEPLVALSRGLGMDAVPLALLGCLFAVATDERALRALTHVSLDYGGLGLTFEALVGLFPERDRSSLARIASRLVRLGLVTRASRRPPPSRGVSQGRRVIGGHAVQLGASAPVPGLSGAAGITLAFEDDDRLALHPSALALMLGASVDGSLISPATMIRRASWHDVIAPPDLLSLPLMAALDRLGQRGPGVVVLSGSPGHCRVGLLEDALTAGRRARRGGLVAIGLDALVPPPGRETPRRAEHRTLQLILSGVAAAARLAALTDADLLIAWPDLGPAGGHLSAELSSALGALSQDLGRPLFVSSHELPRDLLAAASVAEVPVPAVSVRDRARLVARMCPPDVLLPEGPALGELIRATPAEPRVLHGALFAAIDAGAGEREADDRGPRTLGVTRLGRALRVALARRIGDFAQLVPVTHTLADLELPPLQRAQMEEIVTSVRHRRLVMDEWGFATPDRRGQGVTSLFHGPPGTGKTMAAGVLAAELGLEVFRIDLSRVVDKYVGETEKALARVFDEAERGDVLLLFDEADSLFGKRSEASSAVDRHANLGVNYLLQRIEAYRGLVVLTTNHESHMDPAFKRRIRFQILFPMPDAEERARIWRRLIPPEAPLAEDVDFEELGHLFDLSGGHIRSAVLAAAVTALKEDTPIAMRHLVAGGNSEYRALGRVVREQS